MQTFGEPRFFAGGGVFVNDAFGCRRIEFDLGEPIFRSGV